MKNRSGDEPDGCDNLPGRRSSILLHHSQGAADREIHGLDLTDRWFARGDVPSSVSLWPAF